MNNKYRADGKKLLIYQFSGWRRIFTDQMTKDELGLIYKNSSMWHFKESFNMPNTAKN